QQLGEIYYLQRRELRGKFGTAEPLAFRDTDFGLVRIRVFGDFAYKVIDPLVFITQFVGTEGISSSDKVIEWMKSQLIMCLNDALGELKRDKRMAVVDMPAYLQEIEQIILSKVAEGTERYGVKITKIAGLNINLPPEVQEAIDKRAAMGALGVDYIRYQTGKAIEGVGEGAAVGAQGATGAMAGLGAGAGVGLGIGAMMGQAMQQPVQVPPKPTVKCPKCSTDVPEGTKFCPNCGSKILAPGMMLCPKCNADIKVGSKFCAGCGAKLINNCPKCNAELAQGAKFCPNCGSKIE
ncbi:MAG: SPFH domain-containing protein, partial [Candidatus Thermoplasmatota archaeon]